jgi:hypothetical protein
VAYAIQVVFDCRNPDRLARFWAVALGYEIPGPPPGYATWEELLRAMNVPQEFWTARSAVEDPAGAGPRIYFQRVPEEKTVKNRVHLDIRVGGREGSPEERRGRIDEHVQRLLAAGGSIDHVVEGDELDPTAYYVVMRDPEENEFCVT